MEQIKIGNSGKLNENEPQLSPQSEASKLLEQALLQMDGIISGSSTITAHSSDYGIISGIPSVKDAAASLANALQNTTGPVPTADAKIAGILLEWLQQQQTKILNALKVYIYINVKLDCILWMDTKLVLI